ncbi:MAG: Helix-turn-helix domain protein [Bacteroidota bacterium]|nr:Helix-turn-helix domain protein [Bacteroidota bacterium]
MMNIEVHKPAALLSPFVLTYLIIESPEGGVNRVLPGTSLVMAFSYKGHLSHFADSMKTDLPSSSISGLRKSLRLYNYSRDTGNILVLFKEAGAAAFFKDPLHMLFEESISLDNFSDRQTLLILEEKLSEAKNNIARIDLIEQFLLSELYEPKQDELISTALQKIHMAKGLIKIKELSGSLYISQDAFEKRFRRVVGTSPKQFSSIIRMQSVTSTGQQKRKLTDLAYDAGYFDQPHFNKDFKLFTGQNPTEFFKSPSVLQLNDFLQ